VSDEAIESVEVQARITEGGILIGYADEDDLIAQRKLFKPRFASHNPLVRPTLDRLTTEHRAEPPADTAPAAAESLP
jgi:hypothetical protein